MPTISSLFDQIAINTRNVDRDNLAYSAFEIGRNLLLLKQQTELVMADFAGLAFEYEEGRLELKHLYSTVDGMHFEIRDLKVKIGQVEQRAAEADGLRWQLDEAKRKIEQLERLAESLPVSDDDIDQFYELWGRHQHTKAAKIPACGPAADETPTWVRDLVRWVRRGNLINAIKEMRANSEVTGLKECKVFVEDLRAGLK